VTSWWSGNRRARWTAWFAEHGLEKAHRLYLTLDPKRTDVRCVEESLDVEWRAGVPERLGVG
jgi:hypothetical protein